MPTFALRPVQTDQLRELATLLAEVLEIGEAVHSTEMEFTESLAAIRRLQAIPARVVEIGTGATPQQIAAAGILELQDAMSAVFEANAAGLRALLNMSPVGGHA